MLLPLPDGSRAFLTIVIAGKFRTVPFWPSRKIDLIWMSHNTLLSRNGTCELTVIILKDMRVPPKLLFLPPADPCDPGVPPYRLDLKQNYICAIRRKLSIEKAFSS